MRRNRFPLLMLFALLAFLVPLGVRPMLSPDETRYAEIAREMIEMNDWLVPHLNGVRYFEKPVFGYWMFAGSMQMFGQNAFALRLISLLSAFFTGLFLSFLIRRAGAGLRESCMEMILYLTTPLTMVLAVYGNLDTLFTLFVTLTCGLFLLAHEYTQTRRKWGIYFLCGITAGLAFLTKGFLGFALPAVTVGGFLLWQKRWKDLFLLPWLPLLGAVLVIAPWAYLIHRAEPDFWHYFIIVEHWQRFTGGEGAQHAASFFYFIPILLGGICLWIPLLPAVVTGLKQEAFKTPFFRFCFCWFLLPFILLSLSSGKLGTYILPCMAPVSLLIVHGLVNWLQSPRYRQIPRIAACIFGGVCALGTLLLFVCLFTGISAKMYGNMETWKILLLIATSGCASLVFFFLAFRCTLWHQLLYFSTPVIMLLFAVPCALPQKMDESRSVYKVIERLELPCLPGFASPKKTTLVSYRQPFHDVCWAFKRTDVYMLQPGEIDYGLSKLYPEDEVRDLSKRDFRKFIEEQHAMGRNVLVIAPTNRYHQGIRKGIYPAPADEQIIHHGASKECYCIVFY